MSFLEGAGLELGIGHIESGWPSSSPNLLAGFRRGLRELGYIEGETFFIERRYAEGRESG